MTSKIVVERPSPKKQLKVVVDRLALPDSDSSSSEELETFEEVRREMLDVEDDSDVDKTWAATEEDLRQVEDDEEDEDEEEPG